MSKLKHEKAAHSVSGPNALSAHESAEHLFEKIVADLRALLNLEFQRGSANAAARILQMVAANDIRSQDVSNLSAAETMKRAPRGAARALVQKALVKGPMTIREIRESAETPVEKFISYQTVRLELERGSKRKAYKKTKDKWALV